MHAARPTTGPTTGTTTGTTTRPIAIALAGLLSLAVAMGIGRFAFTPLLPMMLHDGTVTLALASWLATANYLGYWVGAMACALQPALWRRRGWPPPTNTTLVKTGLVATVLLTLGMALPLPALWPLWRALAGVASALVFVYVAGWCLALLGLVCFTVPYASKSGALVIAGLIVFLTAVPLGAIIAAMQNATHSRMRGMAGSFQTFSAQAVGYMISPTITAMITDYGFKDPLMIGHSFQIVTCIATVVAVWLFATIYRPYCTLIEANAAKG